MATYLPQTLLSLVQKGMNLHIEGSIYLPQTLLDLVRAARVSGAHVTISGGYLPATLEQLAQVGGNSVTLIVKRE